MESIIRIRRELTQNKISPIYVVAGEETFQTHETVLLLKEYLKSKYKNELNYQAWDCDELDHETFTTHTEISAGLFGGDEYRVFVLYRVEKAAAALLDAFQKYFDHPDSQSCLVLISEKIDKRKNCWKTADKNQWIYNCPKPHAREWNQWHAYMEHKFEKKIHIQAWQKLLEYCNTDLAVMALELEKITRFVGTKNKITDTDVQANAHGMREADIFQFLEKLFSKNKFETLLSYHRLLFHEESPIKLLSLITRQLRQFQTCIDNVNEHDLAQKLGVPPFVAQKISTQAKHLGNKEINRAAILAAQADVELKTSQGSLFEYFILPFLAL